MTYAVILFVHTVDLTKTSNWKPASMFSSSWRQSYIAHWTAQHHLQISDVWLMCRLDDACTHLWPISWMSASRSVQLLETEHSPLLVLGCGTVCQKT